MSWGVVYYRGEDGRVPAEEFLEGLPPKVAALRRRVGHGAARTDSGDGFWEAMHGTTNGYYEIRITRAGQDAALAVLHPR